VVLNVNYRLGPAHRHPSQIGDISLVVRWLRMNAIGYGAERDRIFLTGE
jgi:acetyl esterase/lipase